MDLERLKLKKKYDENILCVLLAIVVSFILFPVNSFAAESLSYSGRLVKGDGSPVTGPVKLKVELSYTNDPTTILCSQNFTGVSLSNGVFHLKLDLVCPSTTLSEVLTSVPATFAAALRVTDTTDANVSNHKTYAFQEIHSMPFANIAETAKQLVQMGATPGKVLAWDGTKWAPAAASAGSVTNVTVTAPLAVVNGASTPALSIVQANTSTDGYLSATDWNTFNNKIGVTAGGTATQFYRGDKTWQTLNTDAVPESGTTNLYFSNARVLGVPLDGLVAGPGVIVATDTVLQAFAKTQGQINLINTNSSGYVTKMGTSTMVAAGTIDAQAGFVLVGAPGSINDATPRGYVDTQDNLKVNKAGDTITGILTLDSDLKIKSGTTTNYVTIKGHATSDNYNLFLPQTDGNAGEVLQTDGVGNLIWINPNTLAAGTGTVNSSSITDDSIMNADINSAAAIDQSKIAGLVTALAGKQTTTLTNGKMLVGNVGNLAAPVTMSGDATLDNTGVLTLANTAVTPNTYTSVTVDAKGRVTNGSNPTTLAGYGILDVLVKSISVNAPLTNTGTASIPLIGMPAATTSVDGYLTSANWTTFNNKQDAITSSSTVNTRELRFNELAVNGTEYVALKSPDILAANTTYTLPAADGSLGQVLTTNAAGALSWTTVATSGTTLAGDVSGTISANTIGAGKVTSTHILDATIVNADVSATANIDATKLGTGVVTTAEFNYLDGVTSAIQTQLNAKQATGNYVTALTGDVTAAGPGSAAATVATVGGVTAANVATGANLANAATNLNTASTIVKRDASGNFTAGTITATLNGTATNVTGTVAVANGGTGKTTLGLNQLLFGNGTSAINELALPGLTTTSVLLSTVTTGAPLWTTSTAGNVLKGSVTGVTFGPLSSTDLPAGTLSGSGTVNYVPYYSAATTLANSPIAVSGSNVGIGTASPSVKLEINAGTIANSTADGIGIRSDSNDFWLLTKKDASGNRRNAIYSGSGNAPLVLQEGGGNVGIGTTTPQSKLDINGAIRVGVDVTVCSAAISGAMRFNSPNVEFCNGTSWAAFGTNGAAVASSQITDGTIVDADINAAANIAATKMGTGLVDNTEFNYLNGVTSSIQTQFSGKQAADATLTSLAAYNTNGILVQTAADTFLGRSIIGVANRIVVTNGDGVAGNPTANIDTTLLPSPLAGDAGKMLKASGANASVWTALGLSDITTALGYTPINKAGDSLTTGTIALSGTAALTVQNPVNVLDAVNKQYVDGFGQWTKTGSDIYRGSGNVGIGTTVPATGLHLRKDSTTVNASNFITMANHGTNATDNVNTYPIGGIMFDAFRDVRNPSNIAGMWAIRSPYATGVSSAGSLVFGTGSNQGNFATDGAGGLPVERMRIDSIGNVGIGTNNPTGRLFIGPDWRTTSGGSSLYLNQTRPVSSNTSALGITYSATNTSVADPMLPGMTLYNDDTTAGGWTPMLVFAKAESGATNFKTATAGIGSRSPTGTGNADSWIDGELHFYTSGPATQGLTSRMMINDIGNVGIGTTAPARNLVVADQTGGVSRGLSSRTYAANPGGVIEIAGSLGTLAAPSALTINKALGYLAFSGFDGTDITLQSQPTGMQSFTTENWTNTTKGSNLYFTTTPNGTFNGVERMRIDQNGNIGIGTSTPNSVLTVDGGAGVLSLKPGPTIDHTYMQLFARSATPTVRSGYIGYPGAGSTLLNISNEISGGHINLLTTGAGNVGIGTSTPAVKLEVLGAAKVGSGTSARGGDYLSLTTSSGATKRSGIQFYQNATALFELGIDPASNNSNTFFVHDSVNNATRFAIAPAGNVGIGTINPLAKLHVSGGAIRTDNSYGDCVGGWTCELYTWDISVASIYYTGLTQRSDRRLKTNITDLSEDKIIERIGLLKPVTYEWKNPKFGRGTKFGFIAQDVEKVWPEIVSTATDAQKTKSVDYTQLISPLVKTVQKIFREIASIRVSDSEKEIRIKTLEAENVAKTQEITALKNYLCSKDSTADFCPKNRKNKSK